jgi:hypothetical protein
MTIPNSRDALVALRRKWPNAACRPLDDGQTLFCVPGVKLDHGKWNAESATVWFVVPESFPFVPPQDFYVDGLRLAHGGDPGLTATDKPRWSEKTITKCFNRALLWDREHDTLYTWVRMCQRWFARRVDGHEYLSEENVVSHG